MMAAELQLKTLEGAVPLSKALPEENESLAEGMEFAITGIIISEMENVKDGQVKKWDRVYLTALTLPDGKELVKLRSSAGAVVRKMKDLKAAYCYATGATKHPVRVRVISREGSNGPYLDLEDA